MSKFIVTADIKRRARELQKSLSTAFYWSSTPQGHEYWVDVHYNLGKIADLQEVTEPEVCNECGQELPNG